MTPTDARAMEAAQERADAGLAVVREYQARVQSLDGEPVVLPHRTLLVGMIAAALRDAEARGRKAVA